MFDIYKKLSVFDRVKYYDSPHIYFIGNKQVTSVTTFIHKFENEFEEDFWSDYKAIEKIMGDSDFQVFKREIKDDPGREFIKEEFLKRGGDEDTLLKIKQDILKEWKYKNHHATYEGSTLHDFAENYFNNKIFPYSEINHEKDIHWIEIKETYKVMEGQFKSFYNDVVGKLIPIKTELVVCDEDYEIAGMVDILFYSVKLKKLVIYDYKTNTELQMKNMWQKMKSPLSHLDECSMNTYSLQLHTYKHIIEKNTGLELHKDCFIVWFNENNENYQMIKCHDYTKEVSDMFEYKMKHKKEFKVKEYDLERGCFKSLE